jgi:hypothetical protein
MRPRTETPSVVFGHERVAAIMVCPVRIWSVSREAWRTGSPYLRRSARQRACGFLWARCRRFASRPPTLVEDRLEAYSTKIRPTDFCHPTDTCLPVPALVALVLSLAAGCLARLRNGSRDTTFHDVVARFGRIRRCGARFFAEAVRTDRASDSSVARSCLRAALSGDYARHVRAETAVTQPP